MSPLYSVTAFAATLALGYLILLAAGAVSGALARGGRRDPAVDSDDAIAVSRFTIPVSVILPVDGDGALVSAAIQSLLALNYPEIEIIVVAEGSALAAVDGLRAEWALEPREFFYRRTLATAPVRRIYGSARDPRVIVVEKDAAGRADALNCGVSLARFRYLVSLAPHVVFDPDALLRLMSPALIDPGRVLAVTSYVERRTGATRRSTGDYQTLASVRSWMATRAAWHQRRCGLPPRDSVVAWRRDAVLDLGGFSLDAADAELDLLIRLQAPRASSTDGRVVRTSEVFGHADTTSVGAAAQREVRRRRALFEAFGTVWKTSGPVAERLALIVAVAMDLATPVVELFVIAVTLLAAAAGWAGWMVPALAVAFLGFGNGLVSAAALLLRGGAQGAPSGTELRRLLLQAPLEYVVYRPALTWSRLWGGSVHTP